ncbi:MAG: exodeoxyribonuclease VII large subunit, partial [Actinomycetota bacterium]|nr:exodeoxyribonuclease VII large subunit [Actinomycetota bacterium]
MVVEVVGDTGRGDATLGVAEALALAAGGVRSAAPGLVWVHGEVEGLTRSRAGHWYWTLAGGGARMAVCALGRDACAIDRTLASAQVSLADGLTLRVRGSLEVYPQRGQVQLRAAAVDPAVSVGGAVLAR